MYISKMVIRYECGNPTCDSKKVIGLNYGLVDIKDIGKHVPIIKSCTKCNQTMFLTDIQAKTLDVKDNYGDPEKGIWVCPIHNTVKYYPNAIKQSVERGVSFGVYRKNYDKITEKGFPWRCPSCGNKLQYYKEEDLAFGYS